MLQMKHFIDSHKAATPLVVLGLLAYFQRWESATLWVYLALHGTYGLLWVTKSAIFGDRSWEQPASLGKGLLIWASLTLYWVAPWLIATRNIQAPPWQLGLCVALYSGGLFLHFAADLQKHTALKLRPGLITDGLFARCRNPNYFGELLIYLGFGLLARHWLPVLTLAAMVLGFWLPQMLRKDRSLARYPGFADYKQRSTLFIPFVF